MGVITMSKRIVSHGEYPEVPMAAPCPDNSAWEFFAEVIIRNAIDKTSEIETRTQSEELARAAVENALLKGHEISKQIANCHLYQFQREHMENLDKTVEKYLKYAEEEWELETKPRTD